jgi:hypothetical protein
MRAKYLFLKCVGYFFGFWGNFGSRFTIWYWAIISSIFEKQGLAGLLFENTGVLSKSFCDKDLFAGPHSSGLRGGGSSRLKSQGGRFSGSQIWA